MAYQYISINWLQILETSTAICITDRSREFFSYLTNRSQSVSKLNGCAASIILNRAVSETDIVCILGWPSLQFRRDYLKCMLVFKSMNGSAPSYLLSDFTQAKKYHTYNTRHRDLIRLPLAKSTKYQGSFRYNSGCTFNGNALESLSKLRNRIIFPHKTDFVTIEFPNASFS